jgi:hypothetical protein
MQIHPNEQWRMPWPAVTLLRGGSRPGGEGDGQVGERDREAEQGRCDLLPAVFCPAVGEQRANEQQGHPGRRGHAQGMPPQADHDACGGEFGCPDEPVAGPGIPKCAVDCRILGWPVSWPTAGSRQASASSSEMVTNAATS